MFKIVNEPQFTHRVNVMVPVDGGHRPESFTATFRVVSLDQLGAGDTDVSQVESLRRVIVKMDELVGEDDAPLTYSDELRDRLLSVPYVRAALLQTYLSAVTKARVGN